jgi:hypothetical protein
MPNTTDLKQAIVSALGTQADAVALWANRVYPTIIPQTAPPGVAKLTYMFDDSQHDTHLTAPAGIRYVSVVFTAYSAAQADIETAREVLRGFFQGFKTTLAGVPIIFVFFEHENDGYDEPISGSDIGTHWKEMPFTFKLRETLPTNA